MIIGVSTGKTIFQEAAGSQISVDACREYFVKFGKMDSF